MRQWNSLDECAVTNSSTDVGWMFCSCPSSCFRGGGCSSWEVGFVSVLWAVILGFVAGDTFLQQSSRATSSSVIYNIWGVSKQCLRYLLLSIQIWRRCWQPHWTSLASSTKRGLGSRCHIKNLIYLGETPACGIYFNSPGAFPYAQWTEGILYCFTLWLFRRLVKLNANEEAGLWRFNLTVVVSVTVNHSVSVSICNNQRTHFPLQVGRFSCCWQQRNKQSLHHCLETPTVVC